ncbi:hypothetical protein SSPSH_002565 [Salinisphaera shabanensis E1L3A]|uniref:Membrane lipoprotein n=2 Tax=Salinisphaera shabanensis TaxID=180542 RepID=U2FQV9_9GAMM|nr:hypothetical protein SSPSH_002565 [Salinisphaera shabanensis E1L3A]
MIERYPSPRKTMKRLLLASLVVACTGVFAAPSSGEKPDDDFSQANRLLFMTDHLQNLQPPATLDYEFSHRADDGESYDDRVVLDIEQGDGAGKQVAVDFLSGDRHRYVPDVGNARGNPIIMMFLQNDVSTLAQRTGGSWRYFQRQIKFALQDKAQVTQETARFDGNTVAVKRIQLLPYASEKTHREKMAGAAQRRYTFVLSDDVPGGVLEISAETPAAQGQVASLDKLTLTPSPANEDVG